MIKTAAILLKVLAGVLAFCLVAAVALVGLAHTDYVQQRALRKVTELLHEQLQTHIEIGHVQVSLFGQKLSIRDIAIDDLQGRRMLQMEELGVDVKLRRLLSHELDITEAHVTGLTAHIYKFKDDSVANYQFVIDAFKSKKKAPNDSLQSDESKKNKLSLDVELLKLRDIKVSYNDTIEAELGYLLYQENWLGKRMCEVRELKTAFVQHTKKGQVDSRVRIGNMNISEEDGRLSLDIGDLCFATDNHLPRKNAGKPKRGAFDAGHFDIVAQLHATVDHLAKDTLQAVVTDGQVSDRGSGLNVRKLRFTVSANKQTARLSDVTVGLQNTTLSIPSATIVLPNKKEGRRLSYSTSLLTGRVVLKDIAKPFSRALSNFTEPLLLQATMSGNDESMRFSQVAVSTTDKKLQIKAKGFIRGLKNSRQLYVHFDVPRMTASDRVEERIINQFVVRKFMMKQLAALGRIEYTGHFDVLWKQERFAGHLSTAAGPLDFHFELDEQDKYVSGTAQSDALQLGQVMDMPDIGKIAAKADFRFDISKPRTAKMRRNKGGKLPIGSVNAEVSEANYKKVKVRNIFADIVSDGAIAEGNINIKGKRVDLLCSFSFTSTDEMRKTKIKPGVKFHKLSDEDRLAKEERKLQKQLEKEAKKAEKDMRAQEKANQKAAKKAEKEARKAEKRRRDSLKRCFRTQPIDLYQE